MGGASARFGLAVCRFASWSGNKRNICISISLCSETAVASSGGAYGSGTIFSVNTDGSGFAKLHDFDGTNGSDPYSGLVLSGGKLYGTAANGGPGIDAEGPHCGTIFSINLDGSGFTNIYNFSSESNDYQIFNGILTNADGANPLGGLVASGGTLYGTTSSGGTNGFGTVFTISTNGTGFTVLYDFTGEKTPQTTPVLSGGTLYGSTQNSSAIYSLSTNGGNFQVLNNGVNDYFLNPVAISGQTLYETTFTFPNGNNGFTAGGSVYSIQTNGSGFRTLHSFSPQSIINAGVTPAGDALYGDTSDVNDSGGQIYVLNTNGMFTVLYTFSAMGTNSEGTATNSDGAGRTHR